MAARQHTGRARAQTFFERSSLLGSLEVIVNKTGREVPLEQGYTLTPILATAFLQMDNNAPWYICIYVLLVSLVSAVSVYLMRDSHKRDITVDIGAEEATRQ